MYEVAMINIAKTKEYYVFNTVLRKIPNIWSFVVEQNIDKQRWDLIATTNSHFFKKYWAIFRFVICVIQNDPFLVP